MAGDAAVLAIALALPGLLGGCVLMVVMERRLTMSFCFSEFITAAPCRVGVAE